MILESDQIRALAQSIKQALLGGIEHGNAELGVTVACNARSLMLNGGFIGLSGLSTILKSRLFFIQWVAWSRGQEKFAVVLP